MNDSNGKKQVLTRLQRGVEITPCPFEPGELDVLKKAQSDGLVRRFGGIFDSRRLGYKSILCALDVAPEQLEKKAAIVSAHPGVTHCYERSPVCRAGTAERVGPPSAGLASRTATAGTSATIPALQRTQAYPNLWFTFSALHDEFDSELKSLNSKLRTPNSELFELPAVRRFKIDVVFDLNRTGNSPAAVEGIVPEVSVPAFSEEEKNLVRAIDQQIPLVERPFAAVAEQIGQSEEWVLSTLQEWKEQGGLRRVGAVLYHRQAGFKANTMCVWPVAEEDMLRAGSCVASRPEVTHCYQRPRLAVFPFDLYAMIHAKSQAETEALFEDISASGGLTGGELFASGREFKKSSMQYFRQGGRAACLRAETHR